MTNEVSAAAGKAVEIETTNPITETPSSIATGDTREWREQAPMKFRVGSTIKALQKCRGA